MNKFGEKKSILTNILTQEELIYIFKVKLNLMFCPCQWQKGTARFNCLILYNLCEKKLLQKCIQGG